MTSRNLARIAVRAILIEQGRLLLVNAYPDGKSDLMCAPGGGVEPGYSLHDNLIREVFEETGLRIAVGTPCLINEFHSPEARFHQVEVFFRCTVISGSIDQSWKDPEQIVKNRQWVSQQELEHIRTKPDSLGKVAFERSDLSYDPLELIVP